MPAFSSTDELTVFSTALTGQYDVEREIGRGGMGVVYLARDLRLDRMVAIKTLPLHLANDPTIRERFLREARTAARLSHPNIVPVHRADEIGGQVFFVMGFVDGDSLAARLAKVESVSPKQAVPILRNVAAALAYAHGRGVVHRDIKTENILLDAIGGQAMVTDFGIARVTEAAPLTATGQVLGTVYYLSPEQVSGEDVDARSDIYALGVVGYAMLAGQFPFDGPLASAVLIAHVNKQPVPLAVVAPHVPASLASIIDRCLAKNPAHRYQTALELDIALSRAQEDADRIATNVPKSASPLMSATDVQAVLKRATELEDAGSPPPAAPLPKPRDAKRDAARTSGFKTQDLREAAREVGIGQDFLQHALVEHGIAARAPGPLPGPTPRATDDKGIRDFTPKSTFWRGESANISFETILDGEMAADDFDLLVDIIVRDVGEIGKIETVGRSMTWTSTAISQGRPLQISVFPRNGKTTIRVSETIKGTMAALYGGIMGGGMGVGAMMFGISMASHHKFYTGQGFPNSVGNDKALHAVVGLTLWALSGLTAFIVARKATDNASKNRQTILKSLIGRLTDQALQSIRAQR